MYSMLCPKFDANLTSSPQTDRPKCLQGTMSIETGVSVFQKISDYTCTKCDYMCTIINKSFPLFASVSLKTFSRIDLQKISKCFCQSTKCPV